MTVLGDKLQAAMSKKASDITTYVWKGPKVNGEQQEILMIDASFDQLKQWYRHCQQMLYNEDSKIQEELPYLRLYRIKLVVVEQNFL